MARLAWATAGLPCLSLRLDPVSYLSRDVFRNYELLLRRALFPSFDFFRANNGKLR